LLKRAIAFIVIICMLFFLFGSIVPVLAQNPIGFTSMVNKAQVAPMEEFYVIHTISNVTGSDIVVRVTEWLEGSPDSFILEVTVGAGQELQQKGRIFNARDIGLHVLRFRAEYRSLDAYEAWIEMASDFLIIETVINTGFSVKYNARHDEIVFRGQSVEFVVEVTSLSNVPVKNILVADSILGVIGEIPILAVGETVILTKSYELNETTQGHIILTYIEPFTQLHVIQPFYETALQVEVSERTPAISLELTVVPDVLYLPHQDEVTLDLKLKNTGEVAIFDIEVLDWNDEIIQIIRRLIPEEEISFNYNVLLEPERLYELRARGQATGIREPIETFVNLTISELKPLVEIEREVINDPQPVLRYIIRNVGNVALVDIEIEELEVGIIARLERMEPGDTEQFAVTLDLSRDRISNPILIAREAANMTIHRYRAGEMLIRANVTRDTPLVTVSLSVLPNRLLAPGTVDIESIVRNEGNVVLRNVEAIIKEKDLRIGDLSELKPGEQHIFESSDIGIELSQSLTVVIRAEDEQGNNFEFESSPVEVSVAQLSPSLGLAQAAEQARDSFLRTIFGIIIILAILTAGVLIYLMKSSFFPIRRKNRQTE